MINVIKNIHNLGVCAECGELLTVDNLEVRSACKVKEGGILEIILNYYCKDCANNIDDRKKE